MGELEPEIRERALSEGVAQAREEAERLHELHERRWQPRIDAHLQIYDEAIDTLIGYHQQVADRTDLEVGADTRWSAIWEKSGRCLAIARVLLHDMRGGFCSESDGTLRTLHEAVQLLAALAYYREEDDLRRWLRGEWVRPAEARRVLERKQAYADERMREMGIEPEVGDLAELAREIYGYMSASAHHERRGFPESVSRPLRAFAYGPHPDPERRAAHLNYAGELLEEVVIVVGDSLQDLIRPGFYAEHVRPLQEAMARVREQHPLPD
jgi:hypothetical protein